MRAVICELPCGLDVGTDVWRQFVAEVRAEAADLVVLNEMPFGRWLALADRFDTHQADAAIAAHEAALDTMATLAQRVVASRPVKAGDRLANEAFALVGGRYVLLHHKQYFPQEPGFFEQSWFRPTVSGFEVHDLDGVRVGALLCSELMFNEWARAYGRAGADVIVHPRASGQSTQKWQPALCMAAVVSGCYVLSSNRVGAEGDMVFGGRGFAYAPGGELLAQTGPSDRVTTVAMDLDQVRQAQADWPCYIPELNTADA